MTPPADRSDRPWRPAQFRVSGVYKRTQQVWVVDRRTGERIRRKVARFDVRYRADGHQFSYTFEQRGWADSFTPTPPRGLRRRPTVRPRQPPVH